MSKIEGLKEQARRHEQNEEWQKALEVYQRAIDRLEEDDAADIGLHNRVGDLFIRVGELDSAVRAFLQAVDLYVESELPNNAIAVCKKILRNVPDRHEVFLRMGQIRAGQGFLVDARTHFLTYAERMQAEGAMEEALRALVEFADAAPDDTGIRLAIASHFEQHERVDEAVEQLVRGYRAASRQGVAAEVEAFSARLAELRPDQGPEEWLAEFPEAAAEAATEEDLELTWESTALGGEDDDGLGVEAAEEVGAGAPSGGGEAAGSWDYGDVTPLDDGPAAEEAPSRATSGSMDDALSAIGPDVSGFERPAEGPNPLEGVDLMEEGDDLELLELDGGEDEEWEDPFAGDEALALESFDDGEEDDDGDLGVDLPFLHVPEPAPGADSSVAAAREESRAETRSGPAVEEPLDARELAERIAAAPDDLDLLQRAVEQAHRAGDERALVEAYLGLGHALRRSGAEARAQAIFREALHVDPAHEGVQAALAGGTGAAPRAVAEVASSEDYVDLGALILGDEDEKTTRFVVAYEEPSGDEQADFAKMLSQFKAKVAENFDASDVKAHHDLGTAYKEMGLLDEAVEEFQAALRASGDHLPTYEVLGQTFLERGTPETAVRVLSRALDIPFEVEDELLGIYYYMGRSHEAIGNTEQALEFYERVFSLDINFADVTERLRALR